MKIHILRPGVAMCEADGLLLTDENSALSLISAVREQAGCDRFVLRRESVDTAFFELDSGLARRIVRAFALGGTKLAIASDFSHNDSKPVRAFIRECNRGEHVFFAPTVAAAARWLALAE